MIFHYVLGHVTLSRKVLSVILASHPRIFKVGEGRWDSTSGKNSASSIENTKMERNDYIAKISSGK